MTADKDALLPCPFCGEVPIIKEREGLASFCCPPKSTCMQSGVFTAFDPMVTPQAIRWWNRRARITAALAEKDESWIKCSERLPSHGERVQIVCEDADGDPYRTIATYNDNEYGPFIRDGGRKAKNPTHWRPLPPLPKGDE